MYNNNNNAFLMCFLIACLFVCGPLLLFWDFLIDIEDTRDVELHAVEVVSNHSPQLVQTRVTRLCNLRGREQITDYFLQDISYLLN